MAKLNYAQKITCWTCFNDMGWTGLNGAIQNQQMSLFLGYTYEAKTFVLISKLNCGRNISFTGIKFYDQGEM